MILAIDTAGRPSQVVLFAKENRRLIDKISWQEERSQSEKLLKAVDKIIVDNGFFLEDIKKIIINQGPRDNRGKEASFTGLKIGASVGNSLAFSLNIPIIGVSLKSEKFVKACQGADLKKSTGFITPKYPKKPNISKKK